MIQTLPPETHRFRIGVVCHDPANARSLLRQIGPLNAMARQDPRLEIVLPRIKMEGKPYDWDFFTGIDAVMFLDPVSDTERQRVEFARHCGARVWVEYIDNIFAVPRSNPAWPSFTNSKRIWENVKAISEMADVVTTTTDTLRSVFPVPERMVVIPESCLWPTSDLPRRKIVTWRGMGSHAADVESVVDAIREIAHLPQFSRWEWLFCGEVPWRLAEAVPVAQRIEMPAADYHDWMQMWLGMAPYLMIVPLPDTVFNRGKTHLAWLEGTACGAGVIGPNLPAWQDCPGLLTYNEEKEILAYPDPDNFYYKLRRGMESWNNGKLHPNVAASRAAVYPERTLKVVNQRRWAVIRKLQSYAHIPETVVAGEPAASGSPDTREAVGTVLDGNGER